MPAKTTPSARALSPATGFGGDEGGDEIYEEWDSEQEEEGATELSLPAFPFFFFPLSLYKSSILEKVFCLCGASLS